MPNSLQTLDTSFPKIDDHQTTEENFLQVTNYLYMLLENLRYTLGNLGMENLNDTELDDMAKMIREPVWARIEDQEGNINNLSITAENLRSQISDINGNVSSLQQTSQTLASQIQSAEGNISSLTQTANSLGTRVSDAEGNLSSLTQTVNGLGTRVSDAEGNLSSLTQTANGLETRVSGAEGSLSSLTQTANGLETRVSGAEGSLSSLTQTVNGMTLKVSNSGTSSTIKLMQNGVAISSQNIVMSGVVTFTDLETRGSTTINGSNITTGLISSDYIQLYGSMGVYVGNVIAGYIGYTTSANDGSAGMHMRKDNGEVVVTSNGAKLDYGGGIGQVSAHSSGVGMKANGTNYHVGQSSFYNNSSCLLGNANNPWGQIYSTNSAISTSDRNKKHSIEPLDERYLALFDGLCPVRFKFNDGTSDRYHPGFISQEVEGALALAGLNSQEFGGFVKDTDPDTGEELYFLRYEEFIAILAAKIKQLEERIQAQEETT